MKRTKQMTDLLDFIQREFVSSGGMYTAEEINMSDLKELKSLLKKNIKEQ